MKKHILQIVGTMNRGGAEMMLMDLVRQLHREFRFTFLVTRNKGTQPVGDFDEELRSMGIDLYYIDAVWDVGPREYARQFREIVRQLTPVDAMHCHLNSKGGINSKCAAKCGIKRRIVHSHAKLVFNGSLISRLVNNAELYLQKLWIKRYATDFWGCSEKALASLFDAAQCCSPQAQVIHNAIELEKFSRYAGPTIREELSIPESAFVIGTVGRIAAVKNYELAAEVIESLWKRGADCHYVVAGRKQTESSVAYLFNKLGHDSRFHYIGVRGDLPTVYHGLNLYLGTSVREGLGLTAVEAQACGKPCLLSTGFPPLCDVGAGLVSFIGGTNAEEWAGCIVSKFMKASTADTIVVEEAVRQAGFDIAAEACRVRALYNA